jgi:hypothetical protein
MRLPTWNLQISLSVHHRVYGASGLQLVQGSLEEHEKATNKVSEWSVETVWLWIHFSVLLPR